MGLFTIKINTYFVFILYFFFFLKIFVEGINVIDFDFITESPKNNMTDGGIVPAIFGTLSVFLMILFAFTVGVFAVIYINEYAKDNLLSRIVKISVNNLAGVPSIVIVLLGL